MKVDKPWGHEIRWAINNKYLGKKEYEDKALKLEEVEELYKNKVITDEERKKMRNKILGIN